MLDSRLDDLVRREAQRRHNKLLSLTATSAAVALVTSGLAIAALLAGNEARAQRNQAEGLIAFMLGDLRKKLEPLEHLDVLDAVGARTMAYLAAKRDEYWTIRPLVNAPKCCNSWATFK